MADGPQFPFSSAHTVPVGTGSGTSVLDPAHGSERGGGGLPVPCFS